MVTQVRCFWGTVLIVVLATVHPQWSPAQGVTTAAVAGRVRTTDGSPADGARVRVTDTATGYAMETTVRHGRFMVNGLDVGGLYDVTVRYLGFHSQTWKGLSLSLGARRELNVILVPVTRLLDTVRTTAGAIGSVAHRPAGTGMMISDATLRRLPTRDRDLYDFVRLVPQVTTRFGISGAGVNHRFNSFLLDGVSERALQGGLPAGGAIGGKAVSLEAVREYQVLLSPYDVRYGDFAGALVNVVSKSGTNQFSATAFVFGRTDDLARATPFLREAPYERLQYGFTLSGPVLRDRVHYFIAPEFQSLSTPAQGPYLGEGPAVEAPATERDVTQFSLILRRHGLEAGSAGQVEVRSPLHNVFSRVDFFAPEWRSRFVLRNNYSWSRTDRFTRNVPGDLFPLSSYAWSQEFMKAASAVQVTTHVGSGKLNELRISHVVAPVRSIPAVRQPVIITRVPAANGARITSLQSGTNELAQIREVVQTYVELSDDISFTVGPRHTMTLGARGSVFRLQVRGGVAGAYGRWEFSSLDSLEEGVAARYSVARDMGGADAPLRGGGLAWYAGDDWRPSDRLRVTYGVRADLLGLRGTPTYNVEVAQTYGRRTDVVPPRRLHWSPRLGFDWNVRGHREDQVRGGIGIFNGTPPLGWFHSAFREYGAGVANLSCGNNRTDRGPVPTFVADYRMQPTVCANNEGFGRSTLGPVTVVNVRNPFVQVARASLAYDRIMPGDVSTSVEAIYTRNTSDFVFVNARLRGPAGTDYAGRILYGSLSAGGIALPDLIGDQNADVIELRKQSNNHSYNLSARAEKRFGQRIELSGAYAFSRVRDVQSATSAISSAANWRDGRVMSGRHESLRTGISAFDVPHRFIITAFYASPWRRWSSDISFSYVGESGVPFTYVAFGSAGRGDLNADGVNTNDPIYIPKDPFDEREIHFSGLSATAGADNSPEMQSKRVMEQQNAFARFVEDDACLQRHAGTILKRNACRAPWVHTSNISIRQSLPLRNGHALGLQLEVFNLFNLFGSRWGLLQTPRTSVFEHVGQVSGTAGSEPLFRFDSSRPRFETLNADSGFQLQLALRYGPVR